MSDVACDRVLPFNGICAWAGFIRYRRDKTSGVATGEMEETMYMVTRGDHVNGGCCFDYGNAETNNDDDGKGKGITNIMVRVSVRVRVRVRVTTTTTTARARASPTL